jgi:hypothetical protein
MIMRDMPIDYTLHAQRAGNCVGRVEARAEAVLIGCVPSLNREELDREATVAFFASVQSEGGRMVERQVEYYNLDAIISVGYRMNSKRGTQFLPQAALNLRPSALHALLEENRAALLAVDHDGMGSN